MKRIEAIIPQSKMSDAFAALKELNIGGFTYYDSKGRGLNPPAAVHSGRGTSLYTPEFNPNLTIFTVVEDSLVEQVVNKILASTWYRSCRRRKNFHFRRRPNDRHRYKV